MAGYNVSRTIAAASTNAVLVKPQAGTVNGWQFTNAAAYAVFLKLYDSATIPTAGAGTPKMTIGFPPGVTDSVDFGSDPNSSIPFTSGIGFTITKLVADADTTVLVANDCVLNLLYK